MKTSRAVIAAAATAYLPFLACGETLSPREPSSTSGSAPPLRETAGAAPALRLPADLKPIAYRATVRLDPASPRFRGILEMDARVASPARVIWLHAHGLGVEQAVATVGGETIALAAKSQGDDLIGLTAPRPLAGVVRLRLSYGGVQDDKGSAGLFRQKEGDDWYSFTQFEAVYARRVFPSVDEPDRKTPWTLTLEVPAGLTALANTRQVRETPLAGGWKRVTFAQTRPLPPHLIAFAVGPFEIADAGKSRTGVPIRIVALKGKVAHTALAVEVVPKALTLLEDYFDYPYPYDKLDLVPIPVPVGFGCMENPGLVTCVHDAMLFDPARPTPWDRQRIAWAAAHELAHQWFGNLVTMAWWDDLWLNEGLATWIEDRIVHDLDPQPDDTFASADLHERALRADRLATARAVRQPIASADDIHNVFDGVTYGKAAAVMTMFERWIGADAFQRGVRAYVKKHADGVATAGDLLTALGEAAGRDVSGVSTFLDQPGAPHLHVDVRCGGGAGGPPTLLVRQSRYLPPGAARAGAFRPWWIPICVAYDRDGKRGETCASVGDATAEFVLDAKSCPRWVLPNVEGAGYYRLTMTREMVDRAIRRGWSQLTPVERVVLAREIRAMIVAGELEFEAGVALIPRLLRDDNRAATQQALALASVRDAVPPARVPAYDRWLVKTFGAQARRLGWLRRPGESLDVDRRRTRVVPAVAEAGDEVLRKDAVRLAARWRDLPRDARGDVLRAAVAADASGQTFDRTLADALVEKDRESRGSLYAGLEGTRDPQRVRRALELLLDPRVDIREVAWLPLSFWREPERTQAEVFVREHLRALLERYPRDSLWSGAVPFAGVFTNACSAERRDEIAASVQALFAALPGGRRDVAQRIEAMDQCIAWRARLGPQLDRWLAAKGAR